jgi:3'(2'), 5'-bisphosphate nucleotidase
VLDPLDGTEGFLRSDGHYAVALALLEEGRPTQAILACPTLAPAVGTTPALALRGVLLIARRGSGTWASPLETLDLKPVAVTEISTLSRARGLASFVESHIDVAASRAFERAAGLTTPSIGVDGQVKHALIATGRADFFVRIPANPGYREAIWDHAAGALAIEEAGGRVTDLEGRDLDFTVGPRLARNRGIVASNRRLHGALLEACAQTRWVRS